MRAMRPGLLVMLAMLWAQARSDVPADAEAPATAPAAAVEPAEDRPFEPPPGFRRKQRGKYVVYCRKDTVMGTRLPAEVCYDEDGIRAMLQAQREDREMVEQHRRICSSQATCGAN
jgi:hypothetical protein